MAHGFHCVSDGFVIVGCVWVGGFGGFGGFGRFGGVGGFGMEVFGLRELEGEVRGVGCIVGEEVEDGVVYDFLFNVNTIGLINTFISME